MSSNTPKPNRVRDYPIQSAGRFDLHRAYRVMVQAIFRQQQSALLISGQKKDVDHA